MVQTLITIYLCGFFFCLFSVLSENGFPGGEQKEPTAWYEYIEFCLQWPLWVIKEIIEWVNRK